MPSQPFSQQSKYSPQADGHRLNYADNEKAILEHALLMIDNASANVASQTIDSEKIESLIHKLSAATNLKAILLTVREEINSLKKQRVIIQKNSDRCLQELNQAVRYREQIGVASSLFTTALIFFMLWLSIDFLLNCYFKGEVPINKLATLGVCGILINSYLLFNELIELRVNKKICEQNDLALDERQATNYAEYLLDLEDKLDKLSLTVSQSTEPKKISLVDNAIQRQKGFARPTSASAYLLKPAVKSTESNASNQNENEFGFRRGFLN